MKCSVCGKKVTIPEGQKKSDYFIVGKCRNCYIREYSKSRRDRKARYHDGTMFDVAAQQYYKKTMQAKRKLFLPVEIQSWSPERICERWEYIRIGGDRPI